MSILTVGAGATGGYLGASLVRAGRDVRFLVRPGRAAQLARDGLVLRTTEATESVPVSTYTAADLPPEPADVVLVTVKAQALPAVLPDFAPAIGPDTSVIPVLNGLRHLAALNDAFGKDRVLGGVALLATQLDEAGEIVAAGGSPTAEMIVAEIAAVVKPAGHPVDVQTRARLISTVTAPGSPFAPSMYRDMQQSRPVEVDEILGDLAEEARSHHIATPLLDAAAARLRVHNYRTTRAFTRYPRQ